jgi:hypothetical protein
MTCSKCSRLGLFACVCTYLAVTLAGPIEEQGRPHDEHHLPTINIATIATTTATSASASLGAVHLFTVPDRQINDTISHAHFDAKPVPGPLYAMRAEPPMLHLITEPPSKV